MNTSKTLSDTTDNEQHNIINKVPEITVLFWIIKILATGMGEAASDLLTWMLRSQQSRVTVALARLLTHNSV